MRTISLFLYQKSHGAVWILLGWLWCFPGYSVATAATLHAIIVADTNDPALKSALKDKENIEKWINDIATATELKFTSPQIIDGESVTARGDGYKAVTEAVEGLQVEADDVVIFYYSGHGTNTTPSDQQNDPPPDYEWPALAVQGNGNKPLLELREVKKTIRDKHPRFFIALADTCNSYSESRPVPGRGDEDKGENRESYRKLFLEYKGFVVASSSKPGELSRGVADKGGYFTLAFLDNFHKELNSADPDWKTILKETQTDTTKAVKETDSTHIQTPQAKVEVEKLVASGDGGVVNPTTNILLPTSTHLPPSEVTQNVGEEESSKQWSITAEEKVWLSRWQTWWSSADSGHYIAVTSENKLASILTLNYQYERVSIGLSFLPKRSYSFPEFEQSTRIPTWYYEFDEDGDGKKEKYPSLNEVTLQTHSSAEREENAIDIGYSVLDQLRIGVGFKRISLDYVVIDQYLFFDEEDKQYKVTCPVNEQNQSQCPKNRKFGYDIYGASLNVGGQVELKDFLGGAVSMFGTFSYGALKTKWEGGAKDYTTYHSTDLGLAWKLPGIKWGDPTVKFGYRAQTLYTEATSDEAVDTTEGFTLGFQVKF